MGKKPVNRSPKATHLSIILVGKFGPSNPNPICGWASGSFCLELVGPDHGNELLPVSRTRPVLQREVCICDNSINLGDKQGQNTRFFSDYLTGLLEWINCCTLQKIWGDVNHLACDVKVFAVLGACGVKGTSMHYSSAGIFGNINSKMASIF
uniref:Uncharacterized protein n=2 Tax=Oryza TaxID=4527 RepID=Q6Z5N8_ORYSJ|nr:hypothetical protein [Oryza sativa Japonica Group]